MDTVWELAAEQARGAPSRRAVAGTHNYSYTDLLELAAEVSSAISADVAPGSVVAAEIESPVAAVLAMLACARSGCCLLPLNTEAPAAYQADVLRDAAAVAVLREAPDGTPSLLLVDHAAGSAPADLSAIAYVLYTSGSTGRPKGVMVPHTALLSRLAGLARLPGLSRGESMLAMTAFSFDISMAEILLPMAVGGYFVASPEGTRLDPDIFGPVVDEHRPDVIQATPSFWRLALARDWKGMADLRIWCGGETLTPDLARLLLPECRELWNLYGPTEATIWATAARIGAPDAISLGAPLADTGVYLVDGEIVLSGPGLAAGYLSQPALTAAKFTELDTPDGRRRCYRTGDLAQYRSDGSLRFLGRADNQVKLRGHRIELGEIEEVLEEHNLVRQAVAVMGSADSPENTSIAVYVVVNGSLTVREIRRWLADRLPKSMLPRGISIVAELPRTTAGKVDRIRLAAGPGQNRA